MEDNPYLAFVGMFGGDEPRRGLTLGKVTSTQPLKVLVGGNTMEGGELLCNTALLGGGRQVKGALTGRGSVGDASGSASLDVVGTLEGTEPLWTVGEQLLMLPIEEEQRYIIICKVVEL